MIYVQSDLNYFFYDAKYVQKYCNVLNQQPNIQVKPEYLQIWYMHTYVMFLNL